MLYWIPYNGNYEKREYDIELHDGTVINECWPNGGSFFELMGTRIIDGKNVKSIRPSPERGHPIKYQTGK